MGILILTWKSLNSIAVDGDNINKQLPFCQSLSGLPP